jgi:hypothetical protein
VVKATLNFSKQRNIFVQTKPNNMPKEQLPPLVDDKEKELTREQLLTKLQEAREENRRNASVLSKNKETIETLGKQHNEKVEALDKLKAELEEAKRAPRTTSVPDTNSEQSTGLPTLKEVYLALVTGLAPTLAINERRTGAQVADAARQVGKHAIGVAQILHKETTDRFHY